MGVDREVDFLDRVLVRAGDDELVNQLRRVRADDVRAEYLTILGATDDLHESFRLARGARAAVRRKGELADLVVELAVLALLLGETHRCDLRVAVRRARDVGVVEQVRVLTGDDLRYDDSLALTLVREHRRTGDVADRVEPLHARLH